MVEGIDDLSALRATLPLLIGGVDGNAASFNLTGAGWFLAVDCAALLDGFPLSEPQLLSFAGASLVGVEAPADAYDPRWVLDSGQVLQLLSEDENAPWFFQAAAVQVEGPGLNQHQDWLAGNIADIDP